MGLHSPLGWAAVHPGDFEAVLALRIRALRPDLERLGRFSPERARERLAADFVPQHARHVLWDGERVGYLNLQPEGEDALRLVHLYLDPAAQGRGIGSTAMRWVLQQADVAQRSLHVTALQGSRAVAFHLRHGFAEVAQDALDVHLVRVQSTYPEGWTIHLLQVSATDDGRVMAIVRVDHPPLRFFATSLCALRDARVVSVDETWATLEEPPAWRLQAGIPQWQRFDPAAPR